MAPRPDVLTDAEEARAAELEAAIVAEERRAEASKRGARPARTVEPAAPRVSSLGLSASEEYRYVARDVRKISIVGGSLVVILLAIWVISHVAGLGPL